MHLKRLEFVGFKSFATRTIAELPAGIVVVVGPNGSGKSNIADAVRWVLGEQSTKAVRARKPEEVIFAGSASRQPLGMAEVSLVLDNVDGALPLEYGDVRVTRRLYRSGDSEYLLNGSRVRLKDVTGTLLHAGLGSDSYAVIGQGSVDELILQRPEERRTAFENAADIRRHQVKLLDTRNKLAATETNLVRVQDVLAELAPHVRRLKTQADRAARAETIRDELGRLSIRYYRHRLRAVRREEVAAERALAEVSAAVEAAEEAGAAARRERDRWEGALASLDARLADLRSRVESARDRARGSERAIAVAAERRRSLEEYSSELASRVEQLDRRIAELSGEEAAQRKHADSLDKRPPDADEQTPRLKAAAADRARAISELETQLSAFHQARDAAGTRAGAAAAEMRRQEERLRALESTRAVQQTRAEDAARRGEALAQALARLEAEEREVAARLESALSAVARAEETRRTVAERAGQATQTLHASAERAARAQAALDALGAVSVSSAARLAPTWAEALDGLPVVGLAAELAERIQPLDRLLRGYLARTVVMADDEAAREAHRRLSQALGPGEPAWAVLSLDGVLLTAQGQRQAEPAGADGTTLADWRRRVRQLEAERAAAARERERAETEAVGVAAALSDAEAALAHARDELREIELSAARTRQSRAAAEADRANARAQAAQAREQVERSDAELAGLAARLEDAKAREMAARAARAEAEAQLHEAEQRLQALREAAADGRARLAEAEASASQRAAEVAAARALLARVEGERRSAGQARATAAERLDDIRAELSAAVQHEAALERERAQAGAELEPLRHELAGLERERAAWTEQRRAVEDRGSGLQAAERAAHARREQALVRVQRARDERERLEQEVAEAGEEAVDNGEAWVRQLRLDLVGDPAAPAPDDVVDEEAMRRRISTLRREMRALGGAGESVVEEFREMSERHAFLQSESEDLRAAMADLREAAAELEAHMQQRFGEVFEAVNAAFQECFKVLFGGGEAQLVLTQPDDLLATGVDVVARPPGKKRQGLLSLSGGERALTVVALLFGLLKVNPTPFCVLDEVDAALDEANVQRFAQLLSEFARRIQFVVVTHNRATMEAADAMYGVSMDSQGVSHVFSIQPRNLARTRGATGRDPGSAAPSAASAII